ncbi:MAG TPA: hypothetical protein HA362_07765 [Nanoarchaeota archaeon]|nr:hypothetical protein [Nanoarchaeota archaeon]
MRKILVLIAAISLLAVSLAMAEKGGPFTLVSCSDTDGDDPMSPGNTEWKYEGDITNPEAKTDTGVVGGGGTSGDVCSEIHYLNVMLYAGEKFKFGEAVLVEGVCVDTGKVSDEPGKFQVKKYYKCKCENQGEGGEKGTENQIGVCTGPAEEIPYDKVKAADEKWMANGKSDLHPWLARFLRLFGLWG